MEGRDTNPIVTTADRWIGGAPAQTRILVGADGQTYVGVWVEVPAAAAAERLPMAISLVIDTSGSMGGEKIANARMAAVSLLESLAEGDIVSVYAFSNAVTEVTAPTVVNAATRAQLMGQVQRLVAGGGTNMYDGIRVGESRLAAAPASHPVRRLVLISDGLANIGPSDPASLGQLAANGTEWGAQVSAIGVGLQYDETVLGALAVQSSGRLYHLQHPAQMATILQQELGLLARTVATDAWIEIVVAPGVEIIDTPTLGAVVDSGRVRLPIGNMYAGQRREVLFQARIDTAAVGEHAIASARFGYREASGARRARVQTAPLQYEVTRDARAATSSAAAPVVAMIANHEATQAQFRAVRLLNEGRGDEAAREFEFADQQVVQAALAAPEAPSSVQLRHRASALRTAGRRARSVRSRAAGRAQALQANDEAFDAAGL